MTGHVSHGREIISHEAGLLSTSVIDVERSEEWCGKVADSAAQSG